MARQAVLAGSPAVFTNQTNTAAGIVAGGAYLDQNIVSAVSITPSVGSLAFALLAPVVTLAANIYAQPSVGALAIAGQTVAVSLGAGHSIVLGNGAITITGQPPIVTSSTNPVQLGLSVGDGLDCYEGLIHWRAQGLGISGIDAILYRGPPV